MGKFHEEWGSSPPAHIGCAPPELILQIALSFPSPIRGFCLVQQNYVSSLYTLGSCAVQDQSQLVQSSGSQPLGPCRLLQKKLESLWTTFIPSAPLHVKMKLMLVVHGEAFSRKLKVPATSGPFSSPPGVLWESVSLVSAVPHLDYLRE